MKLRQRRTRFVRDPVRTYRYRTFAYRIARAYAYKHESMKHIGESVRSKMYSDFMQVMLYGHTENDAVSLTQERPVLFMPTAGIGKTKNLPDVSFEGFVEYKIKSINHCLGITEKLLKGKVK